MNGSREQEDGERGREKYSSYGEPNFRPVGVGGEGIS